MASVIATSRGEGTAKLQYSFIATNDMISTSNSYIEFTYEHSALFGLRGGEGGGLR